MLPPSLTNKVLELVSNLVVHSSINKILYADGMVVKRPTIGREFLPLAFFSALL